jgi:ABC-2 type transport system ATP-binding protein
MNGILKADSLVKRYGDITAVDGISFEIFRGEIFGFLGPNGAGKTTTIKMMSGLLKPDSGRVTTDITDNQKSMGICPQHIVIWENLTCFEQIRYMGKMYNMSSDDVNKKGNELVEALGLNGVKHRLAKNLSGGMKRRLNIALALIHSPEMVFLDEPQAGLDPQSRVLVREYIRSIRQDTTVVLTTHDMEEAEKLSDRICIIDRGKLLVIGTADEIIMRNGYEDMVEMDIEGDVENELIPEIDHDQIPGLSVSDGRLSFSARNPVALVERILKIAGEKNLRVKNLQMRKKSLEDIFINLTGRSLRE